MLNLNSPASRSQKKQEIWDITETQNLWTIRIEEGEETKVKCTENIFNQIIEENFPKSK